MELKVFQCAYVLISWCFAREWSATINELLEWTSMYLKQVNVNNENDQIKAYKIVLFEFTNHDVYSSHSLLSEVLLSQ